MRNRIDKLGVAEPEIRKQGDDQIVIELAGVNDPERAARADRQDRAARALRPPGRPRPALGRRPGRARRRDASLYRPARRPAGARRETGLVRATTSSTSRTRRASRSTAGCASDRWRHGSEILDSQRTSRSTAKRRRGPRGSRARLRAGEHVRARHVHTERFCPGVGGPERDLLLPLQVRPDGTRRSRSRR